MTDTIFEGDEDTLAYALEERDKLSDDLSALRSENERLKGEAADYRKGLEMIRNARSKDYHEHDHRLTLSDCSKLAMDILDKYPKPTT